MVRSRGSTASLRICAAKVRCSGHDTDVSSEIMACHRQLGLKTSMVTRVGKPIGEMTKDHILAQSLIGVMAFCAVESKSEPHVMRRLASVAAELDDNWKVCATGPHHGQCGKKHVLYSLMKITLQSWSTRLPF